MTEKEFIDIIEQKFDLLIQDLKRELIFPHDIYDIGDIVYVHDGSYNVDINTRKKRHGVDSVFDDSFIVVGNNNYNEKVRNCLGELEVLDLLLWSPKHKITIATQSELVKPYKKS